MSQLGPQYTSGGNITGPEPKTKKDITKYINPTNVRRAKTVYDLVTNPKGILKGNPLAIIGILNDIRNWKNKAEVPTEEIEEAGGILNLGTIPG